MPSTVAAASSVRASDCSVLESDALVPRSRRPHFLHRLWRVPSRALQAPECGHPRSLAFEEQAAFFTDGVDPFGSLVPGTDDPSAPFGSTELARLRELIALLVATRTQRLNDFYDRESVQLAKSVKYIVNHADLEFESRSRILHPRVRQSFARPDVTITISSYPERLHAKTAHMALWLDNPLMSEASRTRRKSCPRCRLQRC
jgi:hypothetical protein